MFRYSFFFIQIIHVKIIETAKELKFQQGIANRLRMREEKAVKGLPHA